MKKSKDKDIRPLVKEFIKTGYPDAFIADELNAGTSANNRIDVAAVMDQGLMVGFEIKSASDTMGERLHKQISTFRQFYHTLWLVVDAAHRVEARHLLYSNYREWGLGLLIYLPEQKELLMENDPHETPYYNPRLLIQYLWMADLKALGKAYSMRPVDCSRVNILNTVPIEIVCRVACFLIKARKEEHWSRTLSQRELKRIISDTHSTGGLL